jgi:ABC-type lipoprotein export system ATPase subunit
MIIETKSISKTFISGSKTLKILNGVDFSIDRAEMVALVGVSGSGKSTLLHILGLINRPDEGEMFFLGERVDFLNKEWLSKKRNQNIGFVFQFYSLISELNVVENVMLPSLIRDSKKDEDRALDILESVGMGKDMAYKMVYKLSGGEMQRVALARALMNNPDIVIADEPTANLDKASSIDIVTTMRDINSSTKKAFVIATHSEDIANMCDKVFVLNGGLIREKNY